MQGCPRNWLHSWVVTQETGQPSEYPSGMIHPYLEENDRILRTGSELAAWLEAVLASDSPPTSPTAGG